jgi:hypothetical protein
MSSSGHFQTSGVTTDRAAAYPRVLEELLPAACHVMEQYSTDEIVNPSGVDERGLLLKT